MDTANARRCTYDAIRDTTVFSILTYLKCLSILECGYLGGLGKTQGGHLLTIEEVGAIMTGRI